MLCPLQCRLQAGLIISREKTRKKLRKKQTIIAYRKTPISSGLFVFVQA
jgi:hypothetical protein